MQSETFKPLVGEKNEANIFFLEEEIFSFKESSRIFDWKKTVWDQG
jgi:hypothetical protein